MSGNGGARRKLAVAAMVVLLLVGIGMLGISGAVGLLPLAIVLGLAIWMVARAGGAEPAGDDAKEEQG